MFEKNLVNNVSVGYRRSVSCTYRSGIKSVEEGMMQKKRKAESKKYLPGKDGCFKQKLAKTATISPAICK